MTKSTSVLVDMLVPGLYEVFENSRGTVMCRFSENVVLKTLQSETFSSFTFRTHPNGTRLQGC